MSGLIASLESGSVAPAHLQQPQFFFHVPKTGGTTVYRYFHERFGRENVVHPRKNKAFLVDVVYGRKFEALPELRDPRAAHVSVAGHFASLSIISGQESRYRKVCFWRHPADWSLSYYNWRLHRERRRRKRSYSFSDLMGSLPHNPMTQDFLLYCGDVPGWRYFLMSDRRRFEAAVALAQRFDVFADISKVDEYLDSIRSPAHARIETHNRITDGEKVLNTLDPVGRRKMELLSPVDYYIHRFTLAQDKAKVLAEARAALSDRFQVRDLLRLFARLYYRFKVLVIPFI